MASGCFTASWKLPRWHRKRPATSGGEVRSASEHERTARARIGTGCAVPLDVLEALRSMRRPWLMERAGRVDAALAEVALEIVDMHDKALLATRDDVAVGT